MNDTTKSQSPLCRTDAWARKNIPPLPHSVQEHLGWGLRAEYFQRGDRPKYLGDTALPLEFDSHLYRLEESERAAKLARIQEQGVLAVANALSDLIQQGV